MANYKHYGNLCKKHLIHVVHFLTLFVLPCVIAYVVFSLLLFYSCFCERCTSIDTCRVLKCPSCSVPFMVVGNGERGICSSGCTISTDALQSLLDAERKLVDTYHTFIDALRTSTSPLLLLNNYMQSITSLCTAHHWLHMEGEVVKRDWYQMGKVWEQVRAHVFYFSVIANRF